ncbi:type VI secretion protein [Novosphingobium sediminis]|uniref:Type IV secretion system protein virB4 n=1 Tax=Novosphingobium sediminis TaxID=707214 RepID=A0A512AN86_9SPHN|nr:VirB4 family type IV secretion/conjugal transfer ATPase [Novosphingobium sediminis]GEO01168.1 type VI secretion protein [Novosphingobium sediminis]
MQFLSGLTGSGPAFEQEQSAGSRLPYQRHIDDRTIELRDGSLMQVIKLAGLQFETSDAEDLNYRQDLRDAALRAIGSSNFAVYHHVLRREAKAVCHGTFEDDFSRRLDDAWQDRLAGRRLFVNELYLTLIRRPSGRGGNWFTRLAGVAERTVAEAASARFAADCRALEAASEQLLAALTPYGARVLQVYDGPGGLCSEPLEFLATLYNGTVHPVRLPLGDLGEYLPARRVSFGRDTIELGPVAEKPSSFAAMVSIKDYPAQTMPGMLDDLLRLPFELAVSQSFAFVDRRDGLSRMNLVLRRMRASDDEAISLRGELGSAKDELAAGRAAYGEHHLTVMVCGASPAEVSAGVAEVQASLIDLGMISVREDLALEPTFWAQFPGNFKFIARRALIGSGNFASLASGHNFPAGRAEGNHWGGAVTLFETTAAGPYSFNFHHGDLGNFTVIGPSGSGKTVIVNFLLAQARRFRPRIVFFDKDRGAELFIRAIGGVYDVLRPGTPSRLNPLQLADSPANRRFLIEWVTRLACSEGQTLSSAEQQQVKEAVEANFKAAPAYRRLRIFVQLFRGATRPQPADLYARLRPWWGDGEHAWLFDNAEDHVDLSSETVGFDMTRLLDDPVLRTPAMMYLFHQVDVRLDGQPSIIVVDEGWKALDDDVFVQRIRDWEKTIRKRNGVIGFVTQSAEDALSSKIASAIVEQAATQIFTPNPKAQAEDYIKGFGLSPHEFELVKRLPDTSRCFLVKHGLESVVVRLNLAGETELLTILSGRESSIRLFDEIRVRTGDSPAAWMAELLRVA